MESYTARNGENGLPRRREPDLADLAMFILDPDGRITTWSVTATRLFGHSASAVAGKDVCEVLMTGPGQRDLVGRAMAAGSFRARRHSLRRCRPRTLNVVQTDI